MERSRYITFVSLHGFEFKSGFGEWVGEFQCSRVPQMLAQGDHLSKGRMVVLQALLVVIADQTINIVIKVF